MTMKLEFTGENSEALLKSIAEFAITVGNLIEAQAQDPGWPKRPLVPMPTQPTPPQPTPQPTPPPAEPEKPPAAARGPGRPKKTVAANGPDFPADDFPAVKSKPKSTEASPTVDDVRAALTSYMLDNGEDATKALLKQHAGVERLSQVKIEHYPAVIAAAAKG